MEIGELRNDYQKVLREKSCPERWKKESDLILKAHQVPEYVPYHRLCVEFCVKLMGQGTAIFFDNGSYEREFLEGREPEEVAEAQKEALLG